MRSAALLLLVAPVHEHGRTDEGEPESVPATRT